MAQSLGHGNFCLSFKYCCNAATFSWTPCLKWMANPPPQTLETSNQLSELTFSLCPKINLYIFKKENIYIKWMCFADDKWELASISELKVFVHKIKESDNFFCFQMQRKLKACCLEQKDCPSIFCLCKHAVQQTSWYSFTSSNMEQVESSKGMVCLAKQFFNNCHFLCIEINKAQFILQYVAKNSVAFRRWCYRSVFAYFLSIPWTSWQNSLLSIALKY